MTRIAALSITLALGTILAGCVSDDPLAKDPLAPLLPDLTDAIELVHDTDDGHTLAHDHAKWTDNFRLVAFNSLAHEDGTYNDGNAEVSVLGGYAYVATLGKDSGFVIVDVQDPANPTVVGRYSNPNVYSPDVKVSWDGKYAILSSHPESTFRDYLPPQADVLPTRVTDPLAYTEEDHVTGVTLVDVTDKANPIRVAEYLAEPNGVHNTEYVEIGDRKLIFSVDRNNVAVLEIREGPTGVELVPIAEVFADDHYRDTLPDRVGSTNPGSYLPAGSHDVVYQKHPLTGDHLIYIAFGAAGSYIYNVNDPTSPSLMSAWRGLPADSSYYHYARPVDVLVDDEVHLTVVAPELYNGETTGTIAILDTSDPRNPEELGTFMLPGEGLLIEGHYRFSPHNLDIVNGTMYLANYHAGVWAVDLACDDCMFEPRPLGYYMPHNATDRIVDGQQVCAFWCERPFVWGVVMDRETGLLYASDVESGLYVLEYTPDHYRIE